MIKKLNRIITDRLDNYFKFIVIFLLFLLLSFDRDMATIYVLIMFGDYIWYRSDNFISFPINGKKISGGQALIEGFAGVGLFLLISQIVLAMSGRLESLNFIAATQSIFHLLATSTPILQGNKILTLIGWGVLIPIIETSFFNGRLLEGLSTYGESVIGKKISLTKPSIELGMVIFVVASIFTLFHITAKALDPTSLIITFIFSVISSLMVLRHKDLRGSIIMHIIVNSAAVLAGFGWI